MDSSLAYGRTDTRSRTFWEQTVFLFIEEVLIYSCILMDAKEREKAWAADGVASVTPAALATGRLFYVVTHHYSDQHSRRGEEGMERLLLSMSRFSAYCSLLLSCG